MTERLKQTAPAPSSDHCSPGSAAHHTQNTGLKSAEGVLWMEVVMRFEGSHSFTFSYRTSLAKQALGISQMENSDGTHLRRQITRTKNVWEDVKYSFSSSESFARWCLHSSQQVADGNSCCFLRSKIKKSLWRLFPQDIYSVQWN